LRYLIAIFPARDLAYDRYIDMRDWMPDRLSLDGANRRRSPRFGCSGLANIVCLPSDGALLRGTIRNLSLGGCFIETGLLLPCGAQREILARVEASSFRALAQVRGVLGRSGICVEFVRLSAGGEDMLAELIRHLAKVRAITSAMGSASLLEQPLNVESRTFPILRTFPSAPASEGSSLILNPSGSVAGAGTIIDPLDLFV
jgi:hypothetical protein